METRYDQLTREQFDEHRMEIENRIRNLFWTISGDYKQDISPDADAFSRSKYIALYDAIKQGAFARYFDAEQLGLYIMKKLYLSAEEKPLLELTQLCIDAAVYPILQKDRLGVDEIRFNTFSVLLKEQMEAKKQNEKPGRPYQQELFTQVKTEIMLQFVRTAPIAAGRETAAKYDSLSVLPQASPCLYDMTDSSVLSSTSQNKSSEAISDSACISDVSSSVMRHKSPDIMPDSLNISDASSSVVQHRRFENTSAASQTSASAFSSTACPEKAPDSILQIMSDIASLEHAASTDDIIAMIEKLYNTFYDETFERRHGNLDQVLSVTPEALADDPLRECLTDEQMAHILDKYLQSLRRRMTRLDVDSRPKAKYRNHHQDEEASEEEAVVDEHAVKKVHDFVELNYGKTYLTPLEWEHRTNLLCRGMHENCNLHFTEGILHNPVVKNNQYRFHQMQYEKNRMYYYGNHRVVKRNVAVLADTLQKALVMRQDDSVVRAVSGQLVPSRLWKIGRSADPKLFDKVLKSDNSEFVVDIILDSSGSQARRQSQVAVQGYIISEALSKVGISHRVTGYSTFWAHTILQRYRDYDDGADKNLRIFEFRASANNRDGLAIKAIADTLLQRPEDNKILIVLSDGRPNDVTVRRPGIRKIRDYDGEDAVKDTAFEVRKARSNGVSVLGIFSGAPDDLMAEKKIYGKDFAYIRNISNFSKIVGTYLKRQLDNDY